MLLQHGMFDSCPGRSTAFTVPHLWDGTLCLPTFVYGDAPDYSVRATTAFLAFLACDTTFGVTNYAAYFEPIAGWAHHIAYALLFSFAIVGGFTNAVATALPLELTTIILGLGHIWPALRADIPFGVSFFVLRIVYHAYVTTQYVGARGSRESKYPALWVFMSLALVLHVHWFHGWVKQQRRRSNKLAEE